MKKKCTVCAYRTTTADSYRQCSTCGRAQRLIDGKWIDVAEKQERSQKWKYSLPLQRESLF